MAQDAVVILRTALSADVAPVRCMAARALGDAALLHGLAALDAHRVLVDPEDDEGHRGVLARRPLEQAFMKCLDEEGKPFHFKADAYDIEDVDVEDVAATKAAAGVEAEESVGIRSRRISLQNHPSAPGGEGAFGGRRRRRRASPRQGFAADAQRRPPSRAVSGCRFPGGRLGVPRPPTAPTGVSAAWAGEGEVIVSRVAALLVQLLTASEEPTSSGAELARRSPTSRWR